MQHARLPQPSLEIERAYEAGVVTDEISQGKILPYHVINDFLSVDHHAALLDWTLANEARFEPARLDGGKILPEVRQALSLRDLGSMAVILKERLIAIVPDLTRVLRVSPFIQSEIELELAAHNDGAHFVLHSDLYTGKGSARGDRMLSAVLYFHAEPKSFSGGCLRLHRIGARPGSADGIDIPPAQNSLLCFPSWAPHEVRPVACPSRRFRDSRFAVNAWVYCSRTAGP